jgi:hypothetical protein
VTIITQSGALLSLLLEIYHYNDHIKVIRGGAVGVTRMEEN